jgi:hypothetical protein
MRLRALGYLVVPSLAVLAAAALAAAAAASAIASADRPFPGFLMYTDGAVTSLMRRHWEGPRVGLRPRDVVRAVGGVRVGSAEEALAALERAPGGSVSIAVERPGDGPPTASAHLLVRVAVQKLHPSDMAYVFLMPFCIGVLYLALGTVVFFIKRTRAATLVFLLCLVAGAFYLTMFDAHFRYGFSRIWVCYPLLGPLSIHLFAVFPEERRRVHRVAVLAPIYAAGAVLVALRQIYIGDALAFDRTSFASNLLLAACFVGVRSGWSRPSRSRSFGRSLRALSRSV